MKPNPFTGFEQRSCVNKMIDFIIEISGGLTSLNIAELSHLTDRTVRKVLKRNTGLNLKTYLKIIEALAIYHHYSAIYVAERMKECEDRLIQSRYTDD